MVVSCRATILLGDSSLEKPSSPTPTLGPLLWDFPDQSNLWELYRPLQRTIHVQRPVRAPVKIILEVTGQEASQMLLVQDDHVVQAFGADTPDEPFDVGVLPRTPWGDHDFFDPHVPHSLPKEVP